jgi:hypothetical protein
MSSETEMVEKDQNRLVDEYGEFVMVCESDIHTFTEAIIDCNDDHLEDMVEALEKRLQMHVTHQNFGKAGDIVAKMLAAYDRMDEANDSDLSDLIQPLLSDNNLVR